MIHRRLPHRFDHPIRIIDRSVARCQDLAVWPPVSSVALLVGVYLPLLEAGMQMTREGKTSQSAAVVIFSSALVNPAFGWSLTMLLDNLGLIGDKERGQAMGPCTAGSSRPACSCC